MIVDPAQAARWRESWSITIQCGPDRMDTPERDRVFHWERKKNGKPGQPLMPRKNSTHARNLRGGMRLTPAQATFRYRLRRAIASHDLPMCLLPLRLCVWQTYGVPKTVGERVFSKMDASACLEAVCDALQPSKPKEPKFAGLLRDDGQIVDRRSVGIYEKGVWGLRFELVALPDWGMR
jgi:hypothetical protein